MWELGKIKSALLGAAELWCLVEVYHRMELVNREVAKTLLPFGRRYQIMLSI